MSVSFYILLLSNVLILILNQLFSGFVTENQVYISLVLVAAIGIPHGAIDHLIFLKKTCQNKVFFYSFYLLLISIYAAFWFFFPVASLSFFLLLSAYHFGQSQFQRHSRLSSIEKKVIGFSWGSTVLSLFVLLNLDEIVVMISSYEDFSAFSMLFDPNIFYIIATISGIVLAITALKNKSKFNFTHELVYLILIVFTFYYQSLFLAFSLFFVFNHSLEVMQSEYKFLRKFDLNFNLSKFVVALTPFTLISFFGTIFLYYLSVIEMIEISLPFIILITISSLTLPHAVVMEVFYKKA